MTMNRGIIRMTEGGEVMFSASRKRPRPPSRCGGIRSPLVADSVSTVTKVNTLKL